MTSPVDSRRAANTHRMRRRRSLAARGLPTSEFVDASPARRHIRQLQAGGMGWARIADKAGVSRATVDNLLYGCNPYPPSKRIHQDTARRILGVRLDPADAAHVPGVGTRRRLRALVAIGWTSSALAVRLGWVPSNFTQLINNDTKLVTGATERKVRVLYDALWDRLPPQTTRDERRSLTRARNLAARRGWVSPLAWDDDTIDDPDAVPNLGARGGEVFDPAVVLRLVSGEMSAGSAPVADRVAAVAALTLSGLAAQEIAVRTGMSPRSVTRLRGRAAS